MGHFPLENPLENSPLRKGAFRKLVAIATLCSIFRGKKRPLPARVNSSCHKRQDTRQQVSIQCSPRAKVMHKRCQAKSIPIISVTSQVLWSKVSVRGVRQEPRLGNLVLASFGAGSRVLGFPLTRRWCCGA